MPRILPSRFRIVPKRDFPRVYGTHGFYDRGRWINHGFVVTDGTCNIMPGATWFRTVADAMTGIRVFCEADGDPNLFWTAIRAALGER